MATLLSLYDTAPVELTPDERACFARPETPVKDYKEDSDCESQDEFNTARLREAKARKLGEVALKVVGDPSEGTVENARDAVLTTGLGSKPLDDTTNIVKPKVQDGEDAESTRQGISQFDKPIAPIPRPSTWTELFKKNLEQLKESRSPTSDAGAKVMTPDENKIPKEHPNQLPEQDAQSGYGGTAAWVSAGYSVEWEEEESDSVVYPSFDLDEVISALPSPSKLPKKRNGPRLIDLVGMGEFHPKLVDSGRARPQAIMPTVVAQPAIMPAVIVQPVVSCPKPLPPHLWPAKTDATPKVPKAVQKPVVRKKVFAYDFGPPSPPAAVPIASQTSDNLLPPAARSANDAAAATTAPSLAHTANHTYTTTTTAAFTPARSVAETTTRSLQSTTATLNAVVALGDAMSLDISSAQGAKNTSDEFDVFLHNDELREEMRVMTAENLSLAGEKEVFGTRAMHAEDRVQVLEARIKSLEEKILVVQKMAEGTEAEKARAEEKANKWELELEEARKVSRGAITKLAKVGAAFKEAEKNMAVISRVLGC